MNFKTAVEVKKVFKSYGSKQAVRGVSFEVQSGECFGLLGPNSAGKSTLLRMMYCSSQAVSGEMYVLGLNIKDHQKEIKSRIGVVPQDDGLDPDFSVEENLRIYSSYHEMDPKLASDHIKNLSKLMRLEEHMDTHIEALSGGMRRRVSIARALLNNPELLILDEPTTGLDPQARAWTWDFIRNMKGQTSIILTTHYMEEAENLCDRIAIIDRGQILSIGTPKNLISENIGIEVVEFLANVKDIPYYTERLKSQEFSYQLIGNTVSVFIKQGQESRRILDLVNSDSITIRKPSLNDVFLKLAGHNLRES